MKALKIAILGAAVLTMAACTPQSAHEARGDLHLTAGAAESASKTAASEKEMMGGVTSDIQMDVRNIKDIEAWFDRRRPVSFD